MSEMLDTLNIAAAAIEKARQLELGRPLTVHAGESIQAAIDAAPARSTLAIEAATFPSSVRVTKPITLITTVALQPGRVAPGAIGTWILGGSDTDALEVVADDVTLIGIGAKSINPSRQLLAVTGARFTGKQCALLGSVTNGQHRGLMPHGKVGTFVDGFIDECWLPGRDAQAINAWQDGADWVIDNSYLGGGAEIVMFGGADAPSSDRIPRNYTIRNCYASKRLNWFTNGASLKNALETKCIDGLTVLDSIFEYAGAGQGGYPLLLKSCNQDNTAPWSVTQNVLIERTTFRHGGCGFSIVGQDGSNAARRLNNVTLRNVLFDDIDPTTVPGGGNGRGMIWQSAAENVTVENVTLNMKHMAAEGYFIDPAPKGMVLRNIKGLVPKQSLYGIHVESVGEGLGALQKYAPDAVLQVTPADTGAIGCPT